jgi:hypothetical protein
MASEVQIAAIRTAVLEFDWHNYGLDEVGNSDAEYADWLTSSIVKALDKLDHPDIEGAAATPGADIREPDLVPTYVAVMYDEHGDVMDDGYYTAWKQMFEPEASMEGPDEICVVTGSAMPDDARKPGSYFTVDKVVHYDVASDTPDDIESKWLMAQRIAESLNRG